MLRLDQLYFRNFSMLFFITLLVTSVSGYYLLKKIEINNHKTMLVKMIDQFTILTQNVDNINKIIQEIKDTTSIRVTIIDAQGIVKYESDKDVDEMENHLNRPEIVEALQKGLGWSVRYSQSIDRNYLYVAKYVNQHFIRMAYALENIEDKFFSFWFKAMLLFAFAMAIAFWLAMKINHNITEDLERIKESLDNLLNKKYEIGFTGERYCKEFDIISKQISKVSMKLEKRDRQKAKYTKNLKLLSQKQSDIISAISHEFKNPIAAIIGYTQTVQEDPHLSPELKNKFLEKVMKNALKMTSMIDRLSLAIKLENDTFSPKFSHFKLRLLVEDVKETLLQKYTNREIVLEIGDITLYADRVMFDNLLTNLIENALKYSEDEVLVSVENDKLQVIDKGIGINAKDLEYITKRFFRVDSLTWDNSIGVGLYIVKYILKLHGSYLEIESQPHVGSTFWFDIKKLRA